MAPTSVKFDTRSDSRFFVADSLNLYGTVNQGGTFQTLTASLPANFIRPTSVGFIDNNGVAALLVGGLNNADNAGNPLVVADSSATGVLSGWRRFATSLPNTTVDSLQYDVKADTLAIGTVGRGAYLLYDVTSNFASASVLQFGLANNDFGNRPLVKYGTGTLSIVGASTYTGSSTILQGTMLATSASVFAPLSAFTVAGGATLDLGSFNQTIGSLAGAGNVSLGAAALTAGGDSTSTVFSGGISGAGGSLIKTGAGTLTLSGNNSYTGSTTVNGGILQVDGSIASSGPTQVNANAALTGVGSVGNTVIGANGALMPGNGTPGSSMTFNGSLAFQSAALYLVQINPTTSSFASVTGTASLNGATVNAFYANGSYVPKQYTILTAGSVIGAFNSLVNVNLPSSFKASLSTDLTHAFLNLALDFTPGPTFGRGLNSNQQGVANALTNFFNATGGIPLVYGTLTPSGLTQVSGETATGSQQTTFNAMTQFLGVLTDPFIDGRGSAPGPKSGPQAFAEDDQANAYAASRKRTNAERDAYAIFTKAPLAKSYDPRWSVWAAGFGGSQNTGGNAVIGSNDATSRIFGTAVGADVLLSPRTISGFSLAGGGTNFSVNGFGSGRSDLFQAGAFIRHNVGPAYITGALAYGWQDVTTDRIVTIAGVDRLRAAFKANAFSGRVEGGYRFVTPWAGGVGITPYAAGQFTTFGLPAYAEQVLSGANTFALAYGSRNVTDTRGELGIRADKSFAMQNAILTLRGRAAWAHDFNPDRNVGATFQALPGASFVVNGAAQASDSALITAAAEMKWLNGWSAAATFEGEFSNVTTSYAGKGVVRYAW